MYRPNSFARVRLLVLRLNDSSWLQSRGPLLVQTKNDSRGGVTGEQPPPPPRFSFCVFFCLSAHRLVMYVDKNSPWKFCHNFCQDREKVPPPPWRCSVDAFPHPYPNTLAPPLNDSQLSPILINRYVLVTGCDTGFGNLVTRQLDRRGVHVFAACLTTKGAKDVESQTSERVTTLQLDVTDHDSIVAAFEFVKSKLPKDKGKPRVGKRYKINTYRVIINWKRSIC